MNLRSLAFPVLGAGSGGFDLGEAERIMREEIEQSNAPVAVTLVRYRQG